MPCENILLLHSGGAFNKEPSRDLGNFPSEFQIATVTMNNLFDDITPEQATDGHIDYRCIYIFNDHEKETMEDIVISLDPPQCAGGSSIEFGSSLRGDVQLITILGAEEGPDIGSGTLPNTGYVIFDTEFGAPFTVEWDGSIASFAASFKTQINLLPWCGTVTTVPIPPNAFLVGFIGEVDNRLVEPIRVVQNNLLRRDWSRYNTALYTSSSSFNRKGASEIKTVRTINTEYVRASGTLQAFDMESGEFQPVEYTSYGGDTFTLAAPLTIRLAGLKPTGPTPVLFPPDVPPSVIPPPENRLPSPYGVIEVPTVPHLAEVCITKDTEGSPINDIAKPIKQDTDDPGEADIAVGGSGITFGAAPISLGILRPMEGFFLWFKRTTAPGTMPCLKDCFNLKFEATATTWPPR